MQMIIIVKLGATSTDSHRRDEVVLALPCSNDISLAQTANDLEDAK